MNRNGKSANALLSGYSSDVEPVRKVKISVKFTEIKVGW